MVVPLSDMRNRGQGDLLLLLSSQSNEWIKGNIFSLNKVVILATKHLKKVNLSASANPLFHFWCSIKPEGSQRMWLFTISITAFYSIHCLWFVWPQHAPSCWFPYFSLLLLERGCWCERNFWSTLKVAGEFRPAAPRLCSTLQRHSYPESFSRCVVIANEWTCSEQEPNPSTSTNIMLASLFLVCLPKFQEKVSFLWDWTLSGKSVFANKWTKFLIRDTKMHIFKR